MSVRYLNVIINRPLNQLFTYRECEPDKNSINPDNPFGYRVEIPFGNSRTYGYVAEVFDKLPDSCKVDEKKIRLIHKYVDNEPLMTRELFETACFMSSYYLASIGECLFAMIPSGKRESSGNGFSFVQDESGFERKKLSFEQQTAVDGILKDNKFHYLYGMTGTGKTEVFLSCAESVMAEGKGVIYLVPEIGLTPQVVDAVQKRFGDIAAVLHSELTPSQRLREWKRILHKEARIVIGARSAVFAPVPDLGLLIIDEEHDSSYKSNSCPRYHARQIAMFRCKKNSIPLVMGSATPSLEAWKFMEEGFIKKHLLTRRLAGGERPLIKCIDLNREGSGQECISPSLRDEIKKTIEEKKQTILFLNRRGFTHFFRCASCGFELKCKNCSVAMTYHKSENRLRCHYCGYVTSPPQQCPECGSLDIGYSGFGTEYIENETRAKFPNARIVRVDTDSLHHKGELQEKLDSFKNGEFDIMLGTQMVAKGLNFPNLKLVGVVLADTGLHLPDFRAGERTFALITQVAGRAGRFFPDGRVFVQSYAPDRDAINYAVKGDLEGFYQRELEMRQMLGFPPYTRLIRLVFRSTVKEKCENAARDGAFILGKYVNKEVEILGPAECPVEMENGKHRQQVLLRGKNIKILQETAKRLVWKYKAPPDVYIEVDVDPQSLL